MPRKKIHVPIVCKSCGGTFYFKPSVEKDLRKINDTDVHIIMKRIERLVFNPFPSQVTKISNTQKTFRIRVRDYWIIYEVDMERSMIKILYIRHRRDAYRNI